MASVNWLKRLFIPVFAILLMSHNAFAVNFNYNVRLYDGKPVYSIVQGGHTYGNRVTGVAYNSSISITTNGSIAAYDGMLFDVPVFIYNYADNNATDGIWTPDYVTCNVSCQWVGFELQSSNAQTIVHNYIYISASGNLNSFVFRSANTNNVVFSLQSAQEELYVPIVLAYRFVDLSGSGSTPDLTTVNTYIQYISSQLETIYAKLGAIDGSIPSADDIASAITQDEQTATQDAADNASSSGSSSAADAETATSSLISVIGGFVNVLTTATPTNCKINANLNHINMGELDLCANPVPSYIQIIGSIILICAVIPLAIVLFNRFIGLFRSFQG